MSGEACGAPPDDGPVVFRPGRTRAVLLSGGTALLVTFTAVALSMPDPWTTTDRAIMITVGLLVSALSALLSRPKAVATRAGVTVVNLTTRRCLQWPQILGVHLRPGDPWVSLDLADGTTLAVMAIQPGNGKAQAVRDAARLRELAERYGTGRPAG